jgi:hypothetical protein
VSILDDLAGALGLQSISTPTGSRFVLGVLVNPRLNQQLNIDIPQTITSPNAAQTAPIFSMQITGYGGYLYSLAMLVDQQTQLNYLFFIQVDGVSIDNNTYFQMPIFLEYDPIAEGTAWTLPAGANIKIYAYNALGSQIDGNISVSVTVDEVE